MCGPLRASTRRHTRRRGTFRRVSLGVSVVEVYAGRGRAVRLYIEIARRAFRQQLTYRAAAISGLLTNAGWGCFKAFVFVALYRAREGAEIVGYDLRDALTFVWFAQAMIAPVAIWGWFDIAQTITSGAVVSDLSRPYDYYAFWFARDAGRAAAQILLRGVPSLVIGAAFFDIRFPTDVAQIALFAVALALALVTSFALRFIVNLWAFWLLDWRGIAGLWNLLITLLSGFELPLAFFPEWARPVVDALPFRGIIQTPADLFLGHAAGVDALALIGRQAMWVAALVVGGYLLVGAATRKVVVQGG